MQRNTKQNSRTIKLLGIPACLGAPLAGCARGPAVIRELLKSAEPKLNYVDLGDITVPQKCKSNKCINEIAQIHKQATEKIRKLSLFKKTKNSPNPLPVLIGGDHSMNYSFIQEASAQTKKRHKSELGLIWFDAHGDFNTPETTITGNVHGMILSALAGRGIIKHLSAQNSSATKSKSTSKSAQKSSIVFAPKTNEKSNSTTNANSNQTTNPPPIIKEENICIFGVRDLDPKEEELLKSTKITIVTAKYIKKVGIKKALQQATAKLPKYLHLSFDLDVFDPRTAPGTNTPSIKGFSGKHLDQIMEFFQQTGTSKPVLQKKLTKIPKQDTPTSAKRKNTIKTKVITSIDIMEFNPNRDRNNKTAKLAIEILKNACQVF